MTNADNSEANTPRRELAVALKYDGATAPRVTAKGSGKLAERIVQLALEHEIPMQENAPLVQALAQLDLDEQIPPALYLAVAEIIAFAYYMSGKFPPGVGNGGRERPGGGQS